MLGTRVDSLRFEKLGTFTTEVWRLHVAGAGAPASLVLKRAVPGRAVRIGESFETEIRFYRELSHRVGARVPRFHAGGREPGTGLDFLLVEDVGPLPATDWRRGPSDAHARAAVAALARMHASFLGVVDDLDWVPSFADPALLASFEDAYARNWPSRRDFFSDMLPAFGELGDAILGRVRASHAALAEDATLLHGDAHAENMPWLDGQVVLLDWAGPRRGSPGVDLGFFIPMSFPVARRREVERSLVEQHAAVMREQGVRTGVDPWLAYRRGVLRRVARIVGSAHTWDPGAFSSLEWIFHRCATAAVELRVADLL